MIAVIEQPRAATMSRVRTYNTRVHGRVCNFMSPHTAETERLWY